MMWAIYSKELRQFLNSLIAYVVIGVFLTGIGLLMWVFPETSVLNYGFADMGSLFSLGPFVFMFLIPAITMRMLAEERRTGTIELLLTKPLTEWQIVMGKYLAAFTLVVFSVLPTLVYFYSVYQLGNPIGNLDVPGITGSYLGLILLGGVFTAIGLAASSFTENQIVSFILAVFLCFFLYTGVSSLADLLKGEWAIYLEEMSLSYHYDALSRGLIDTRNVAFFVSTVVFILIVTHWRLIARKLSYKPVRSRLMKRVILAFVLLLVFNILAANFFYRYDLTEDKRYTLKPATKELLRQLEAPMTIEVLLAGDLPSGFERFRRAIKQTIEEFDVYKPGAINYFFVDPSAAEDAKTRNENIAYLMSQGFEPTRVFDTQDGKQIQKIIFPYVIVRYDGQAAGILLFKGAKGGNPNETINMAIENIEFELAVGIQRLANLNRKNIGMVRGHNELDSVHIAGFMGEMVQHFNIKDVSLNKPLSPDSIDALIIARPKTSFSKAEKYVLDQYVMHGGDVVFLMESLEVNMSNAAGMGTLATPVNHGLEDLLFRYGVRLNQNYVQDIQNFGRYPVVIDDNSNIINLPWPFYASVTDFADHPASKNLDAVYLRFFSTMDTVKAEGVSKTPLMYTSEYTRILPAPAPVAFEDYANQPDVQLFNGGRKVAGYLLEGQFTSLFKNRVLPDSIDQALFKDRSTGAKIVVVSDGDFIRNELNLRTRQPYPLGFNPFVEEGEKLKYANRDFLFNVLAYMTDEEGLITSRNKEITLRPLNRIKVQEERTYWQSLNLAGPLVILVLFGLARGVLRKRKYSGF
ncbi:gliding motility-associated ABC transporter substrate-binding protein GldG [uncultured Roseivirga sp.]|uniref:gliding motility-associated ABC transporter substrate-binding protein GldG n=1 Tax=Roseivirga sp. UBA1976 TaxID=1947386 RepID=UPI002EC278FF|nr:gliding motility-associated ABC transporter substrate-binding protein GldG [Bacteroidota bacterium]|tara:strand:+ start:4110 stop:6521 length:2412 start_codon:yes stop_codon:yes gene_type:complete